MVLSGEDLVPPRGGDFYPASRLRVDSRKGAIAFDELDPPAASLGRADSYGFVAGPSQPRAVAKGRANRSREKLLLAGTSP